MPTYTFDFNLSAWIRGLEIEADSEEEAREKLNAMSIDDIVDLGYCSNFDITSVDVESDEEYIEDEDDEEYDDDYEEDVEDGLEKEVRVILKRVGLKPEEKIKYLKECYHRDTAYFVVDDLTFLRKGGRIKATAMAISKVYQ